MKNYFNLIFILCFCQIGHAQHFIGQIKYETFHAITNTRDTFDLFVDEKVIVIKDGARTKHSAPYRIHLLEENKKYTYFKKDTAWIWMQVVERVNQKMFVNKPIFIGKEQFLGIDCEVHTISREMADEYKSLSETDKIWISKHHTVKDTDHLTYNDFLFFNKTGSIILKLIRETSRIPALAAEESESIASSMTALSIQPVLPKEYFDILVDFKKWRGN